MSVSTKVCLISLTMFLAACGGGGGGPTPGATTPPPAPSPEPTPVDYNTAEYRANWGLDGVNAIAAYDDGLSGAGLTIAVIDTGIDLDQSELTTNTHAASKDLFDGSSYTLTPLSGPAISYTAPLRAGGAQLDDIDGHGTFVAGLIAAERNGVVSHGLAFEAKVLAVRTDNPGSCATDCLFDDNPIAAALNYAVANGADVVNMSLGGTAAEPYLEGAMRDATAAGVVIVISAGNANEDFAPFTPAADPDPFPLAAIEPWANSSIIIAGSSNDLGAISDFSNRAGSGPGAAFYLLAPGEDVLSTAVDPDTGEPVFGIGSGTSFAAPVIASAAALLMEKFPALTSAEVVDILLTSATDIGPVGVDATNGRGILNIEAAIAPIGTTSLSIKTLSGMIVTSPDTGGLVAGGAFGDGFGLAFGGGAVFTDAYDRAYATSFDNQIQLTNPLVDFQSRFEVAAKYEAARMDLGRGSMLAFAAHYERPQTSYEEDVSGLSGHRDEVIDQVTVRVDTQVTDQVSMSFGFGGPLENVLDQTGASGAVGVALAQGARLPWLSDTSAAATDAGIMSGGRRYGATFALPGGYRISAVASEDEIGVPELDFLGPEGPGQATRTSTAVRLGHAWGAGDLSVTLGHVEEKGVVLGSFSSGILGLGDGAMTDFLALGGQKNVGDIGTSSLSVFGHFVGTSITIEEAAGSAFSGYRDMHASQFAVGLALEGVALNGNQLSLTMSQPLRLEAGRVVYGFAADYDYDTDTPLFDATARGLTPSGRELDLELAWHFGLGAGTRVSANLLYQHAPGHVAGRDGGVSVMLTGRSSF